MTKTTVPTPFDINRAGLFAGYKNHASSSRIRNLVYGLRSTSVIFPLLFIVIFGISISLMAASLWEHTRVVLITQLKSAINNDAIVLSNGYGEAGLLAVTKDLQRLSKKSDLQHGLYLIVDHEHNLVAGNLPQWPGGVQRQGIWYNMKINSSEGEIDAIFRVYSLPDGFRLLVGQNKKSEKRIIMSLKNNFISVAGEMFIISLCGGLIIRSLFVRALADLNTVAVAVSTGDLTKRIRRKRRGGELDRIAETLNEILERMASLLNGVKNVTSAISHDLRTPVTRARTRLESAIVLAEGQEHLIDALSAASSELDRITAIFDALLRIAEVESGARRSAFREFDIAARIESIIELFSIYAEDNNITLATSDMRPTPMFGDPDMVQQALVNLLDNAVKFTPFGGHIQIDVKHEQQFVVISVSDDGPGISAEDRLHIGERFFRAEKARSTPGSGLGLSLVASVCQLHHGELVFEDNAPGLKASLRLLRSPLAPI